MVTRIIRLLKRFSAMFNMSTLRAALVTLTVGAIVVTPSVSVEAVDDQWTVACTNSPSTEANYLFGVAAQADDAVVAVGSKLVSGYYQPLIERWSPAIGGPCFVEIDSYPPLPLPGNSELFGIAAIPSGPSQRSLWAVGYYGGTTRTWDPTIGDWIIGGGARVLILRSDNAGKTWSRLSDLDQFPSNAVLKGVSASSDEDASAVGYYYNGIFTATLALQWDGFVWSRVDSRNETETLGNYLNSVSIADKTHARAVGFAGNPYPSPQPQVFNSQQQRFRDPVEWRSDMIKEHPGDYNYLFGVTDLLSKDPIFPDNTYTFAVGAYIPFASQAPYAKLTQAVKRREDTQSGWDIDHSPNPSTQGDNILYGIAPIAANYLWAVGSFQDDSSLKFRTLVERRGGSYESGSWQLVSSPNTGTEDNVLRAVTVVPGTSPCAGGNNWAVGYYLDGGVARTLAMVYYITPACDLVP